jgi:hypothetical protein
MGTDTKRIAGVGGGFHGLGSLPKQVLYKTGLLGQDGTGAIINQKINIVNVNNRIEASDTLKRRTQGYRGL